MRLESKKDYQELLMKIVKPLLPYYTEDKSGLVLGDTASSCGQRTVRMEAFLRPLWGLVPFWAGGGENEEFEQIYRRGLTSGTDPKSSGYWQGFWDGDQRFVEMASIAYGLILIPEKLWEPLNDNEKDNLMTWLDGINQYKLPACNWIFFAVLVNLAMKKCGRPYNAGKLEEYLQAAESFYMGDGWYRDGDSDQKDYYVSFGFHFYSLFYAKVMADEDPERCKLFKERAITFARQFIYWFDDDGAALPYGRSLTYRFAQVSFFCACLMADVYPFSVGEIKGLIARHFKFWLDKPIFDRAGILTIGYGYPNLIMAEKYNAPGSPYWSLKTFAILMLQDDHPFWSVKAEPMPALEEQKALRKADMLIRRYGSHTTAFVPGKYSPNGLGQTPAKYGKFAYDTRFAFCVAKSTCEVGEASPDSMLSFYINGYVYTRRICEGFTITDSEVVSRWVPYPGITVETTITPNAFGHLRKHVIESEIECVAYDCGFSVQTDVEGEEAQASENSACAGNVFSFCEVTKLKGDGEGTIIDADPNTNLLYPMARIPAVCYRIPKGTTLLETRVKAEYQKR